jgi:AcrR family transcriptional regulator
LIAKEGLKATTMERVAAMAKISKPVLYSHFDHRADLLRSLLEEYYSKIDDDVASRLHEDQPRSVEGYIYAVVEGVFDAMEAGGVAMQILWSENSQEPLVEEARRQRSRTTEASWSEMYQRRYGLSPATADVAAALVRATVAEVTAYWLRTPDVTREECALICTRFAQAGLRALSVDQKRGRAAAAAE